MVSHDFSTQRYHDSEISHRAAQVLMEIQLTDKSLLLLRSRGRAFAIFIVDDDEETLDLVGARSINHGRFLQ